MPSRTMLVVCVITAMLLLVSRDVAGARRVHAQNEDGDARKAVKKANQAKTIGGYVTVKEGSPYTVDPNHPTAPCYGPPCKK